MRIRNSLRFALVVASLFAVVVPITAVLAAPEAAGAATGFQVTTTSLPGATVGQPYSAQLQATGGTPPYTFTLINETYYPLPPGLSMSLAGLISGTPGAPPVNQPTTYTIQVNAWDSTQVPGPQYSQPILSITLTPPGYVAPSPLEITTTSIPDATDNEAYSYQMQAMGGTPPYAWSATNLPQGFTMSSSGVISGQSALPEQASFTVEVTDSGAVYNNSYGVQSSSQQSQMQSEAFTVTSGYPQLDSALSELSALLAQGTGTPNSIVGEIETLLATALPSDLAVVESTIGDLLCDLTSVNGGLGCLVSSLP